MSHFSYKYILWLVVNLVASHVALHKSLNIVQQLFYKAPNVIIDTIR